MLNIRYFSSIDLSGATLHGSILRDEHFTPLKVKLFHPLIDAIDKPDIDITNKTKKNFFH